MHFNEDRQGEKELDSVSHMRTLSILLFMFFALFFFSPSFASQAFIKEKKVWLCQMR